VTVGFSFTSVQHTYPRNPLPQACWISSWFDAIRGAITRKAHGALDLILANGGSNDGGSVPMIGTPVTAMEDGTVDGAESGNGPASNPPYSATGPSCTDNPNAQGNRGNYVRIKGGDQYLTTYYHMTPAPGMTFGHPVVGGQTVIGYLDASGCQSKPHLHVQRNGPGYGPAVDLSIPCVNSNHQTQFDDGLVDDAVPDNL
jgi:murein DD-endopeptidase MepM/ murein hydrolase activator NlpD